MHFVYVSAGVFALFISDILWILLYRAGDKNQGIQLTLTLDGGVHGCVCTGGGGLSHFGTLGHGTLFSLCGSLSNCRVFNIPGLIY